MNPQKYNIVVSLKEFEGESIYVGTALEYPDVRVYEPSFGKAYCKVTMIIRDLSGTALKMGHFIPAPLPVHRVISGSKRAAKAVGYDLRPCPYCGDLISNITRTGKRLTHSKYKQRKACPKSGCFMAARNDMTL